MLIKVEASSVNPLDLMMTKGYGDRILKNLRENNHSLVLGRDFSGTVVGTGMDAQNDFKIGDQVYGATFPSSQGSHTEFVTASKFSVAKKPKNLNHLEAASLPFTALTAWSAMMVSAGMSSESQNKNPQFKVLVLGASGGVGTFAVQLLKALNYSVVAVSQDFEMVVKLGADVVLDYTAPSYQSDLQKLATFDVIFDFAGLENQALKFMDLLRPWSNAKLVTLMSPLLRSTDQDGLIAGSLKTLASVVATNAQTALSKNGTSYRYGYFMLNPYALQTITNLVEKGKVIYNFAIDPKFIWHFKPFDTLSDQTSHSRSIQTGTFTCCL